MIDWPYVAGLTDELTEVVVGIFTTREPVAVGVLPPPEGAALMVNGNVPGGVAVVVVSVKVTFAVQPPPGGGRGFGLNVAVTPAGSTLAMLKVTFAPPLPVALMS
jgi:hypothetical protein